MSRYTNQPAKCPECGNMVKVKLYHEPTVTARLSCRKRSCNWEWWV